MTTLSEAKSAPATAPPASRRWKGHTDSVTDVQPLICRPCSDSSAPTTAAKSKRPDASSSSSSSLIASTSDDHTIRIWQSPHKACLAATTTRCLRYSAHGEVQPVSCCTWYQRNNSGPTLFTAHPRCLAVWSLHTCPAHPLPLVCTQPTLVLPLSEEEKQAEHFDDEGSDDEINQLLVSADGSTLAACADTGRWYSWRISRSLREGAAATTDETSSPPPCPSSLCFQPLGRLQPPHANICANIAFLRPRPALCRSPIDPHHGLGSSPLILSAGFDYSLLLSSADGTRRMAQWNVSDWVEEQREKQQAEEEEQASSAASQERKQPTRSTARKGQTAAERLREKLKQKQPVVASPVPTAKQPSPLPSAPSASSAPLTNPPFPHCLAASPVSQSVLVGLGNGQLALLSAEAIAAVITTAGTAAGGSAVSRPPLIDAHGHALVSVAWLAHSAAGGCDYWISAGSDKRIALWRSEAAATEEREKAEAEGAAVQALDVLSGLAADFPGSTEAPALRCVWSVLHGWKVNNVSCAIDGVAGARLYIADVSQRVSVYTIT